MSKKILNLNGIPHVRISYLENYGLSPDAIMNRLSDNRKGTSRNYDHFTDPTDRRIKWVKYDTIPPATRRKFGLPIIENILNEEGVASKQEIHELIVRMLQHANEHDYIHYIKNYHGIYHDHEVIEEHARTHAVLHACADLKRFGIHVRVIYPFFQQIEGLVYPGKSLKSFYHKLSDFEKRGAESIIHGRQGKRKSFELAKPYHFEIIEKLFRSPKMLSGHEITDRVNEWAHKNGYQQLSVSTVRRVVSSPHFQNKNRPYRNGKEWSINNFEPFKLRLNPEFVGELWQLDGSRLQIPYFNEKTKSPSFLHLFVVLDIHSKKIIGYSTDLSENHVMVEKAIKMAIENVGYLPKEILKDSGTCFGHKKMKFILQYFNYLGAYVRTHKIRNPRDKAQVERLVGVIQYKVFKHYNGYIGEGIKSKNKEARPSKIVLESIFQSKNLRSKKELENLVPQLIMHYNNIKSKKDNLSPNLRFECAQTHRDVCLVSDSIFRLLFWERKMITVKNSMIILSEGSFRNKQFQYIIEGEEQRLNLNLTEVIVCYNRQDRSFISIYDKLEKWIMDVNQSKPVKMVMEREIKTVKEKPVWDESIQKIAKISRSKSRNKNNVFQQPATLDVLLVKTKEND